MNKEVAMSVCTIRIACCALVLCCASLVAASFSAGEPPKQLKLASEAVLEHVNSLQDQAEKSAAITPTADRSFRVKKLSAESQRKYDSLAIHCTYAGRRGDHDAKRKLLLEILALCRTELPEEHYLVRKTHAELQWDDWFHLLSIEERAEVEKVRQRLINVLFLLHDGNTKKAQVEIDRASATISRLDFPPSDPTVEIELARVGCLMASGNKNDTVVAMRRACAASVVFAGEYSKIHARCLTQLAAGLESTGKMAEGARAIREACRIFVALRDEDLPGLQEEYAKALLVAEDGLNSLA
jgi:hypothetical protein